MPYRQTINTGQTPNLEWAFDISRKTVQKISRQHDQNNPLGFLKPLYDPESFDEIMSIAQTISLKAKDVVILGTGGSSLGAQALVSFKEKRFAHNATDPKVHFPDNLSPFMMSALLQELDLQQTHFLIISKSGGTAETLAQLMSCMAAVKNITTAGAVSDYFTVIVEPGDNVLLRFARRWRLPVIDHDPDIGGRFSVLSNVGILPAAIAGLDIQAIHQGAQKVYQQLLCEKTIENIPAAFGAATLCDYALRRQKTINVLMPYESRLEMFARWHQQLWAESIGKDGRGSTPVRALGPVDQHSQLQLYLDGPDDKFFTFITTNMSGTGPVIDASLASDPELGFMSGRTVGDLVTAQARATMEALKNHGKPVRHIKIDELNECSLGALLMHFMLETVIAADIFDVNAFDQPAVEEGKQLTRQYMEWGRRTLPNEHMKEVSISS